MTDQEKPEKGNLETCAHLSGVSTTWECWASFFLHTLCILTDLVFNGSTVVVVVVTGVVVVDCHEDLTRSPETKGTRFCHSYEQNKKNISKNVCNLLNQNYIKLFVLFLVTQHFKLFLSYLVWQVTVLIDYVPVFNHKYLQFFPRDEWYSTYLCTKIGTR